MDRRYSLKRNKEFRYVYRSGKSVCTSTAVLVYRVRKTPGLRVGFSVSKKIGGAVQRNRVRRRLKEAFRTYLPCIDRRVLIIIVARSGAADADYKRLVADMHYLLKKAGLFTDA